MNRWLIILGLLLFSCQMSLAQLKTEVRNNEISFNATTLLQNVFAITPGQSDISPYILQYRRINWEKNWATRVAFGLNFNFNSSQGTFFPSRTSSESNFRLRLGKEKRIPVSEKLFFIIGLDAFGQVERQKVNSNTTPITTTVELRYNTGLSPVFGLSLKFASRATLSIETSFNTYYQYRKSTTETNNGAPPTIFTNRTVLSSIDQPFGIYFGFNY